jgi:hypothetical protein
MQSNGVAVDPDAVRESIIATVSAQVPPPKSLERNEFVREVLTFIHVCVFLLWLTTKLMFGEQTDKAFVDKLWQQYKSRTQ